MFLPPFFFQRITAKVYQQIAIALLIRSHLLAGEKVNPDPEEDGKDRAKTNTRNSGLPQQRIRRAVCCGDQPLISVSFAENPLAGRIPDFPLNEKSILNPPTFLLVIH
ncbi:MAG: hypothetical protein M1438_18150 [Deltaproteobacteria bacterium]|nr:hypothetical protein [Deltaproteobacteria bacterium]